MTAIQSKPLPDYQTRVTSLLMFTENSMGCPGVIRGTITDGKVSELHPVSSEYLKEHIELISGNQKMKIEKTLRCLPSDVRYYNPVGRYAGVVLTHKPSLQTIKILLPDGITEKSVQYEFPYLLLIFNARGEMALYYYFEEIVDSTPLYAPALPNFGGNVTACWGTVKKPKIAELDLKRLKAVLWSAVFGATYTHHSNQKVFAEMLAGEKITRYKTNKHMGTPVDGFKSAVNKHIGLGTLNLFDY